MHLSPKHQVIFVPLLTLFLTSCAQRGLLSEKEAAGIPLSTAEQEEIKQIHEAPVSLEEKMAASPYKQIPVVMNDRVQFWIDYFQGRGRRHMERYLGRSTRYLPLMKEILRKEELPEDLVYIALIESGFNSSAYSRASAVGYWQFIRGTGRRYGLKINGLVDERRDFVLSTYAAAAYFKSLYNLFGSWYLAIASYNVGENRIKRVVMKDHTRDFWEIVRNKRLPAETINYVPKFLAAMEIGKNPEKYGFAGIEYQPPLAFDEVSSNKGVNLKRLARNLKVPYKDLKRLNPAFRTKYAPIVRQGAVTLRIPAGYKEQAVAVLGDSYIRNSRYVAQMNRDYMYYRVRRGDTLSEIARRYRTRVSVLRRLNGMGRRSFIRAGRRIKVPVAGHSYRGSVSRKIAKNVTTSGKSRLHIVRRGDTLIEIARRYSTSVSRLAQANNLGRSAVIYVGSKLVIPD